MIFRDGKTTGIEGNHRIFVQADLILSRSCMRRGHREQIQRWSQPTSKEITYKRLEALQPCAIILKMRTVALRRFDIPVEISHKEKKKEGNIKLQIRIKTDARKRKRNNY